MPEVKNVAKSSMRLSNWRPFVKNSLRGYFDLILPSGLVITGMSYYVKDSASRWVSPPSRSYTKADGSTAWSEIVSFTDKDVRSKFLGAARDALDSFFEANPNQDPTNEKTAAKAGTQEDSF